jgi:hypothetical protein
MRDHDEANRVSEPASDDAGCAVDWSWLEGLTIESATSDLQHWRVRFTNGLTLTIQASSWNEKPFLAFKPYKAPGA